METPIQWLGKEIDKVLPEMYQSESDQITRLFHEALKKEREFIMNIAMNNDEDLSQDEAGEWVDEEFYS